MNDYEIITLYFERDENAISETENKYGAYCSKIANIDDEYIDEMMQSSSHTITVRKKPVKSVKYYIMIAACHIRNENHRGCFIQGILLHNKKEFTVPHHHFHSIRKRISGYGRTHCKRWDSLQPSHCI